MKRQLVSLALKLREPVLKTGVGNALYYRALHARALLQSKKGGSAAPPATGASPKYRLGIFTRVYNEGHGIQEFLAFHILQGVEHFYIYDNQSTDDTVTKLQPFIDAGYVTLNQSALKPMSPTVDYHCMTTYGNECQWIACIDADEFLFTLDGKPLPDFLEDYSDHAAVVVHWKYFGSNGHRVKPDMLVIEAYTKANRGIDITFKSIVQPQKLLRYGNPHYWFYTGWQLAVNELGHKVHGPKNRRPTANLIRINHYVAKSFEEYMAKTALTYGADRMGLVANSRTPEKAEEEMLRHNDVVDEAILVHVPGTKAVLERILQAQSNAS